MMTSQPDPAAVNRQWVPVKHAASGAAPARPGLPITKVETIIVGDTGYLGLRAADAATDVQQAYGHFLIDDKDTIECVPALTSRAGRVEQAFFIRSQAGQEAQKSAITVNLCFGGEIKPDAMLKRCTSLLVRLCKYFDLDPAAECILEPSMLDAARTDPDAALQAAGTNFPDLVAEVGKLLAPNQQPPPEPGHV